MGSFLSKKTNLPASIHPIAKEMLQPQPPTLSIMPKVSGGKKPKSKKKKVPSGNAQKPKKTKS
jgi:hypothetical protein